MFRLLLAVVCLPFILSEPLTWRENHELQQMCGKFQAPKSTPTRRLSMNTPRATRQEAPYTVAIRLSAYSDDTDPAKVLAKSIHYCTGTLISPRHVITAAHCLVGSTHCTNGEKPSAEKFFDGMFFLTSTVCNETAVPACDSNAYIRPKKAYIPRAFTQKCPGNRNKMNADFAIVELEKDLAYSETVQPACLNTMHPADGTTLFMFGFGSAPGFEENGGALRKLVTTVVPWKECKKSHLFKKHHDAICSRNKAALACGGDSGSGQMVIKENKAFLSGILNYGVACRQNLPDDLYIDFSSTTVLQNHLVAALTGVNPGYPLTLDEEARKKLEETYYEYTKENPL